MLNPEDYKDYQVLGANIQVILDGFGSFTLLASKILLESGLGTVDAEGIGMAVFDPAKWYPLDAFLRSFQRIGSEFGDFTLRQSGIHINKKAAPPGELKDIATAFTFLNAGYHFNHAKDNKAMFNPQTGEITAGIGDYRCNMAPGQKALSIVVDCPYPCAFDEGVVLGMAHRFHPTAKVTHDPKGCRKKGQSQCTYNVAWK